MSTRRIYQISITTDDQAFLFADIDANVIYTIAPLVVINPIGDAIINIAGPPSLTGFSIVAGSAGLVPSVAAPIAAIIEVIPQGVDCLPDATELMTPDYVKCRFPDWETFCTREDGLKTADEMLQIAIDMAEAEFLTFYGALADADVTEQHRFHILRIVRFNCFGFRHGDSGFEHQPAIVKQYESTRKKLEAGLLGANGVKITSKERLFDESFTDDQPWYEGS